MEGDRVNCIRLLVTSYGHMVVSDREVDESGALFAKGRGKPINKAGRLLMDFAELYTRDEWTETAWEGIE